MIFDTHIHLNDEAFLDIEHYLNEAKELGINRFLCVGFDLDSSKKAIELANKFDCIYACIGIIPTEHKQYNDSSISELDKLLNEDKNKRIVAVGEIGLDYYWEKEEDIKMKQKQMFIDQINLANKYNLPISIHARESLNDCLTILKEHKVNKNGIMHCYSGSKEMAQEFIKLGFYIAFGGVLTFKNSRILKEVLASIDVNKVVFETDAPYLAPVPYRGKLNEPKYIYETVKYASNLLNIDQEKLEKITYKNSCDILHVENYEN